MEVQEPYHPFTTEYSGEPPDDQYVIIDMNFYYLTKKYHLLGIDQGRLPKRRWFYSKDDLLSEVKKVNSSLSLYQNGVNFRIGCMEKEKCLCSAENFTRKN